MTTDIIPSGDSLDPSLFASGPESIANGDNLDPSLFETPNQEQAPPPEKDIPFFGVGDAISGVLDALRGIGPTGKAAFYQLTEGLSRPDQYSDKAKAAFAEADAYGEEMKAKSEDLHRLGLATSAGDTLRETGPSLGFSFGSMAAAIPASIAGAKIGGAVGGSIGTAATIEAGGAGGVLGAEIGAAIGGTTAGFASSMTAGYRMAGAQFLRDSMKMVEDEAVAKRGKGLTEAEREDTYQKLLPIAKNTALWEAGPEAVGNAITMGAGKIVFGFGKTLAQKFTAVGLEKAGAKLAGVASTKAGAALIKAGAIAGDAAVELGGESITQVEQSADQRKADALAKGEDYNAIHPDWSNAGMTKAFKEVAPQTLATMMLMGGAAGGAKIAQKQIQKFGPEKTQLTKDELDSIAAERWDTLNAKKQASLTDPSQRLTLNEHRILKTIEDSTREGGSFDHAEFADRLGMKLATPETENERLTASLEAAGQLRTAEEIAKLSADPQSRFYTPEALVSATEKTLDQFSKQETGSPESVVKNPLTGEEMILPAVAPAPLTRSQELMRRRIESSRNEDGTFDHKKLAVATNTKVNMGIAPEAAPAAAKAQAAASEASEPNTFTVPHSNGQAEITNGKINAESGSAQHVVNAIFGSAPAGMELKPTVNPKDFHVDKSGRISYSSGDGKVFVQTGKMVRNGVVSDDPKANKDEVSGVASFYSKARSKAATTLAPETSHPTVTPNPAHANMGARKILEKEFPKASVAARNKDEKDTYTIDGNTYPTVTTIISKNYQSPKASSSSEQKQWDAMTAAGIKAHSEVEQAIEAGVDLPSNHRGVNALAEVRAMAGTSEIATEHTVHSDKFAGTIDVLFQNNTGGFTGADYKFTDNITPEKKDKWRLQWFAYRNILAKRGINANQGFVLAVDSAGKVTKIDLSPTEKTISDYDSFFGDRNTTLAPTTEAEPNTNPTPSWPKPKPKAESASPARASAEAPEPVVASSPPKAAEEAATPVETSKAEEAPEAPEPRKPNVRPSRVPKQMSPENRTRMEGEIAEIQNIISDPSTKEDKRERAKVILAKLQGALGVPLSASVNSSIDDRGVETISVDNDALKDIVTVSDGISFITGDDALGELEIGTVIHGMNGEEVGRVLVVTQSHFDLNGEREYVVSPVYTGNAATEASERDNLREQLQNRLESRPEITRALSAALPNLRGFNSNSPEAVGVLAQISSVFRGLLASRLGVFRADLIFNESNSGNLAYYHNGKIHVDPAAWATYIQSKIEGVRDSDSFLMDGITEHLLAYMDTLLFEELHHEVFTEAVPFNRAISLTKDLLSVATVQNKTLLESIGTAFRNRAQSMNRGKAFTSLSNEEVIVLLDSGSVHANGKLASLTREELAVEQYALSAEFAAAFAQRLHSGVSSADAKNILERYILEVVGDPTTIEPSLLSKIIKAFTHMINEGLAAMKRFMDAHRMAQTLPASVLEMSNTIDAILAKKGISAPDPTRVKERFMKQANRGLDRILDVNKMLRDQKWSKDGTETTGEAFGKDNISLWEVQRELRSLLFHASEKLPKEVEPVRIDFLTGTLQLTPKAEIELSPEESSAIQDKLDMLNSGNRLEASMEVARIARDAALVLRNLNGGIPVNSSQAGVEKRGFDEDVFYNKGEFESAASVLNERLSESLEHQVGLPVSQIINELNRTIGEGIARDIAADEARITSLAPFAGVRQAFSDVAAILPDVSSRYEGHAETVEAATAAIADAEARWEAEKTNPDEKIPQAILEEINNAVTIRTVAKDAMEAMEREAVNYRRSGRANEIGSGAKVALRDAIIAARNDERQINSAAIERLRNRQALRAPFRSIGDVADAGLSANQLRDRLDPQSGIDASRLHGALATMKEARDAYRSLYNTPERLEFLLIGGSPPVGMESDYIGRGRNWNAIQPLVFESGSHSLLPLGLGRFLRGNKTGLVDQTPNIVTTIEDENGNQIPFDTLPTGESPDGRDMNRAADAVDIASLAAQRLLGVEPTNTDPIDSIDLNLGAKRNGQAIGSQLAKVFRRALLLGDTMASDKDVTLGGYPRLQVMNDRGQIVDEKLPERIIDFPLASELTFASYDPSTPRTKASTEAYLQNRKEFLHGGYIGRVLAPIIDFLNKMEQNDSRAYTNAVLWHSDGITPAGASYEVLTPAVIQFLSLTKGQKWGKEGVDVQAAILNSFPEGDANRAILQRAYDGLAAGLETSLGYRSEKANIASHNIEPVMKAFWNVYRMGNASNAIYQGAIHESKQMAREARNRFRENEHNPIETESPIVEKIIDGITFNLNHVAQTRPSEDFTGDQAVSLLATNSSIETLKILESLDKEQATLQFVRGQLNQTGTGLDDATLMLTTDDKQSNADRERMSDQMSNSGRDFQMQKMKDVEKDWLRRRDEFITSASMMLLGGNVTAVRRFINSPQFLDIRPASLSEDASERNLPVPHWNREAIINFLREELTRLRSKEIESGSIFSARGSIATRGNLGVKFDESIDKIAKNNPEFQNVFNQVKWYGGNLHRNVSVSALSSQSMGGELPGNGMLFEKHTSEHSSVVMGLLNRIPGLYILTSHINYDLLQGDEETRIPSINFVPDAASPMLILPYGQFAPSAEESQRVVGDVLRWMHEHGKVDVIKAAQPIVERLASVSPKRVESTARIEYAKAVRKELMDSGITVGFNGEREIMSRPDSDVVKAAYLARNPEHSIGTMISQAAFEAMVDEKTTALISHLNKATSRLLSQDSDRISPDVMGAKDFNVNPDLMLNVAISSLSLVLTNPSAKKVFLLATLKESKAGQISDEDVARFGEIIHPESIPGMAELAYAYSLNELPSSQDIELQYGMSAKGPRIQKIVADEEKEVVENETSTEPIYALPSFLINQAEWANRDLYSALNKLFPQNAVKPIKGVGYRSGITEFEARQMISIFGSEMLSDVMTEKGMAADKAWGTSQYSLLLNNHTQEQLDNAVDGKTFNRRPVTASDLVDATGMAAERIKALWASKAFPEGQYAKFGTFSYLDPMIRSTRNPWSERRKEKYALAFAEALGIKFEASENATGLKPTLFATVIPDLKALAEKAKAIGMDKRIMSPYDESGRIVLNKDGTTADPESIEIFEAYRREVLHESLLNHNVLQEADEEATRINQERLSLLGASDAVEGILKQLDGASATDIIRGLSGAKPGSKESIVLTALSDFAKDREAVSREFATNLLDRFASDAVYRQAFQRQMADPSIFLSSKPFSFRSTNIVNERNGAVQAVSNLKNSSLPAIRAASAQVRNSLISLEQEQNNDLFVSGDAETARLREGKIQTLRNRLSVSIFNLNKSMKEFTGALGNIMPDLYGWERKGRDGAVDSNYRRLYIDPSASQEDIRRGAEKALRFVTQSDNLENLRNEAIIQTLEKAARDSTRLDDAAIRSMDLAEEFSQDRTYLSRNAIDLIKEVLTRDLSVFDQEVSSTKPDVGREGRLKSLINEVAKIIRDDIYTDEDLLKGARSLVQAKMSEFVENAKTGAYKDSQHILEVIHAFGRSVSPSGTPTYGTKMRAAKGVEVDPLLRQQSMVRILKEELQNATNRNEVELRMAVSKMDQILAESKSLSSYRKERGHLLNIEAGPLEGGGRATQVDVEAFYRAMKAMGSIGSRLYMDILGRNDFAFGYSDAAASESQAEEVFLSGVGAVHSSRHGTYNILNGVLEPIDAKERIKAVLAHRGIKATTAHTGLVAARLKNLARNSGKTSPKFEMDLNGELIRTFGIDKGSIGNVKELLSALEKEKSDLISMVEGFRKIKESEVEFELDRERIIPAISMDAKFLQPEDEIKNMRRGAISEKLSSTTISDRASGIARISKEDVKNANENIKHLLPLIKKLSEVTAGISSRMFNSQAAISERENIIDSLKQSIADPKLNTKIGNLNAQIPFKSKEELKDFMDSVTTLSRRQLLRRAKRIAKAKKDAKGVVAGLKDKITDLQAEIDYLNDEGKTQSPIAPPLFASVPSPATYASHMADVDRVIATMNAGIHDVFSASTTRTIAPSILNEALRANAEAGNDSPIAIAEHSLRHDMLMSKQILDTGELVNKGLNAAGIDLNTRLNNALLAFESDPNNRKYSLEFYETAREAIATSQSNDAADILHIGYVQSKSPHEAGWYYRLLKNSASKVKGVWAKSLEAQDVVSGIHSEFLDGNDGRSGKNAGKKLDQKIGNLLLKAAEKIEKKTRYLTTSRGLKLAEIKSILFARKNEKDAAAELIEIYQNQREGMVRAVAASKSFRPSSTFMGSSIGWVSQKVRQMLHYMMETSYEQITNRKVFFSTIDDIMPVLELLENGTIDGAQAITRLESLWGKQAKDYSNTLMGVGHFLLAGVARVDALRGADKKTMDFVPPVPITWGNQSRTSYSSDEKLSVKDMLSMDRAVWFKSANRKWSSSDVFDVPNFNGITGPHRVFSDMVYRMTAAPAYDHVSAMVGDVSTDSSHFSGFSKNDLGELNRGAISKVAEEKKNLGLFDSDAMKKSASSALAIANMIRDEVANDMINFSPNTRAISIYRTISRIGLARKLLSLTQAVTQPAAPVIGYVATNGMRGLSFLPILWKYNQGSMGRAIGGVANTPFYNDVNSLIETLATTLAVRLADSVHMLGEMSHDTRPSRDMRSASPVLGRLSAPLSPLTTAASAALEGLSAASGKGLEWIIAKPENSVIRPMFAHELLHAINRKASVPITMDQLLRDPFGAGATPQLIRIATNRVEELFGPGDRAHKGMASQPASSLGGEIGKSFFTTLAGHPINMAAMSDSAWRMLYHNKWGSPESKEGLRLLSMTTAQNLVFAFLTGPAITYAISSLYALAKGMDEPDREKMEGSWYGIKEGEGPNERRKRLAFWVQTLLSRNGDPYGYSWYKNEWSDKQRQKHDGYHYARVAQEAVNQLPLLGSLSSTTLGQSLLQASMKAAGVSPNSSVQKAGVILPEKWGFTGMAAQEPENSNGFERSVYLASKVWFNYLNDVNAAAFSLDSMAQALKMASNNPNELDGWDWTMITGTLAAPKFREIDREIERGYSMRERDYSYEALAPWSK